MTIITELKNSLEKIKELQAFSAKAVIKLNIIVFEILFYVPSQDCSLKLEYPSGQ